MAELVGGAVLGAVVSTRVSSEIEYALIVLKGIRHRDKNLHYLVHLDGLLQRLRPLLAYLMLEIERLATKPNTRQDENLEILKMREEDTMNKNGGWENQPELHEPVHEARKQLRDGSSRLEKEVEGELPPMKCCTFGLQTLERATNNFSHMLGRGGSAVVYLGELGDGIKIAVKRMKEFPGKETAGRTSEFESWQLQVRQQKLEARRHFTLKSFESEAEVLPQLHHRHIIKLLGRCTENNEDILVFEYMPHGNLEHHILHHKEQQLQPLDWIRRLRIALDVAQALEYLHNLADNKKYIHRDVKPENILLDKDMRAKLSDFGLVRATAEGENSVETKVKSGTWQYCAPEYFDDGFIIAPAMDVYSFGLVLIVLVTGKGVNSKDIPGDFVAWFRAMNKTENGFVEGVDPVLKGADLKFDSSKLQSILGVAQLALKCAAQEPGSRPTMTDTVNVLTALLKGKATSLSGNHGGDILDVLSQREHRAVPPRTSQQVREDRVEEVVSYSLAHHSTANFQQQMREQMFVKPGGVVRQIQAALDRFLA